jgi:hypothetical protein
VGRGPAVFSLLIDHADGHLCAKQTFRPWNDYVFVRHWCHHVPNTSWLKLGPQGFTVRYWFKEDTYRWTDVKEFKLITLRYMGLIPVSRSVGFTFSENYPKRNIVLRIAGALAAFDRKLPNNYGMKAQDLLILLESCRRQAAVADQNLYQVPWPAIEPE